ncbi:uncharacterized protein F5Z01DRAFT_674722 [Emericellopsis atlantica]|uniref:Uncharacterized protein n=1 Tax=Emericellopsis atlantica TaxID=2614577 RepID=A0A9P7ZKT6_9HYPO|nr:uncharacterized protein F5Z01DRAFT_674722 [Emericellopsis atlantica]KAG9253840.1 hypothetical protein F5Z01DRAFT_674722 [Emericellopsis atlantica]
MGNAGPQGQPTQQATPNRALVHQVPRQQAMNPAFRNDGLDGTYALPQANMGALVQYGDGAENLYQTGLTWIPGQRMARGYSDEGPRMSRQDSMSSDSVWTSPSSRANRYDNDFQRRPKREIFDIREDDQCMTDAQARDKLSSYVVIRMEKANVDHDVDRDGNKRQPTWEKAEQVILTDVSEKDAHRKVRELDTFTPFIADKRSDLAAPINRQLDHALNKLEEQEIDSRYCYELAQIDQKEKKVEVAPETQQPYYIELPPSKSKSKGRKDSKKRHKKNKPKTYLVEPHSSKPRREKQTVSITAYFRRTPKPDENCLKMLHEADDNWNQEERVGMQSARQRQPSHLFPNRRHHSPSSPERRPRQQSGPLALQDLRQTDPRVQSMVQAQQPGFAQHYPQQRLGPSYAYQVQQDPQSQQGMATLPAGQANSRAQSMHALHQQQLQDQQRQLATAQRMQQSAQKPAVQQTGTKPGANMQSVRGGGQVPPPPPINQQRGQPSGVSREPQPQAKQQGARPVQLKQDSKGHQPKKTESKGGRREEGRKHVFDGKRQRKRDLRFFHGLTSWPRQRQASRAGVAAQPQQITS